MFDEPRTLEICGHVTVDEFDIVSMLSKGESLNVACLIDKEFALDRPKRLYITVLEVPEPIYDKELPEYGALLSVEEFLSDVEYGGLIDYDGSGHPVKDGKMANNLHIYPSIAVTIPEDATHIMWFNK